MEVCEEHDLSRSPVSEHYNTTEHHYKFRIMQVKSNHSGSQTHTEGDGWLMVCISITKQPLFSLSLLLSHWHCFQKQCHIFHCGKRLGCAPHVSVMSVREITGGRGCLGTAESTEHYERQNTGGNDPENQQRSQLTCKKSHSEVN